MWSFFVSHAINNPAVFLVRVKFRVPSTPGFSSSLVSSATLALLSTDNNHLLHSARGSRRTQYPVNSTMHSISALSHDKYHSSSRAIASAEAAITLAANASVVGKAPPSPRSTRKTLPLSSCDSPKRISYFYTLRKFHRTFLRTFVRKFFSFSNLSSTDIFATFLCATSMYASKTLSDLAGTESPSPAKRVRRATTDCG